MAEAAAQAAALKAFQDAMQQAEGNGYNNAGYNEMTESNFWMYGSSGTNETQRSYIEEDERRLMESIQQGNLDMEMFNSGVRSQPDDASAHELLRLLEQQQQQERFEQHELQQQQMMSDTSHREESFLSRPDKHYLTIAQNGKLHVTV